MKKPKKSSLLKQKKSNQLEKVATKMIKKYSGLSKYKDIKL